MRPARLIANLHGLCNPPGYACGYWVRAASEVGWLACAYGNARYGAEVFHARSWGEPLAKMDEGLERAVAAIEACYPGEIRREGAVLTGFSRGASVAPQIAAMHPGLWTKLILVEADVALDRGALEKAGVRAVALVAGEKSGQIAGERRTAERLGREGFRARLWVMRGAGHTYSADIDQIMREALAYVLSDEGAGGADGDGGG